MQENNYTKNVPVKLIIEAILNTKIRENRKLRELIDFFDFAKNLNKRFDKLSGGQKQRLTIILVLMEDAPLTFLDEVTSGLDFETRGELMDKIREWYRGKDSTVAIVSHYYDELKNLTDKLLILDGGKVVDFGKTEDLFRKYCGETLIVVEDASVGENFAKIKQTFAKNQIPTAKNATAFSCTNLAEENKIVAELSRNNIDFRRTSDDIESLFSVAVARFREKSATKSKKSVAKTATKSGERSKND
jgi:ABC-2 type transport system ATP-binding protein